MIKINQRNDELIEFDLNSFKELISCMVHYSLDDKEWQPASMYRSQDTDYLIDKADWRYWNNAILKGIVRFDANDTDYRIYWNKYLNIKLYTGRVYFRFEILTVNGIQTTCIDTIISSSSTVYIDDWSGYTGDNGTTVSNNTVNKWFVMKENNGLESITAKTEHELPQIEIHPDVQGLYDVYVCLKTDSASFHIHTDNCKSRTKFITGGKIHNLYEHNFKDKLYKEIKWKTILFTKSSRIMITQILTDRAVMEFGCIAYLKLVPSSKNSEKSIDRAKTDLTLYYEPYSYAAIFRMLKSQDVEETLDEFFRLSPSEITCQVCRIGSKTLHYSKFLERFDIPADCDDRVVHDGPARLVQNMDVLKFVSEYCRKKDVVLTVCLGVNSPYLWLKEISEGFSENNPDKIKNGLFDYTYPEVMDYACSIVEEIVNNYDIDGITLDFMRREDNQTKETLVELVQRVRKILDCKVNCRSNRMRLTVRVPSERIEYFDAAKIWVKENLVDVIVPSNSMEMDPVPRIEHYVHLCRQSSVKVFGCIDGWKKVVILGSNCGNLNFVPSCKEIRDITKYYRELGAEGIFVYQADNYVFNAFVSDDTFHR